MEYKEAVLYACSADEWMQWTQMHIHLCWQTHLQRPGGTCFITFLNRFSGLSSRLHSSPGEVNSYIFKRHQFLKHQGYSQFRQSSLYCCPEWRRFSWGRMGTGWMMIMLHVGFPWFHSTELFVCLSDTFMDTYTLKNPYFTEISHEVCFSIIWVSITW